MTVTLDLPSELEAELSTEAARLGITVPEYVMRLLTIGRTPASRPKNGAELVAYWESEGLIGSRPDIANASEHARGLRGNAESKFVK